MEELRERRLRFHRNSEGHVHEMVSLAFELIKYNILFNFKVKQRMQTFQLNVQQYSEFFPIS